MVVQVFAQSVNESLELPVVSYNDDLPAAFDD